MGKHNNTKNKREHFCECCLQFKNNILRCKKCGVQVCGECRINVLRIFDIELCYDCFLTEMFPELYEKNKKSETSVVSDA
jgi:hypothetical protein